jgi:hypothetical protein
MRLELGSLHCAAVHAARRLAREAQRPSFQPQARRSFLAAAGVADVRAI